MMDFILSTELVGDKKNMVLKSASFAKLTNSILLRRQVRDNHSIHPDFTASLTNLSPGQKKDGIIITHQA